MSFAFQWQRCDGTGSGCVDVLGATGANHLLGEDDVGSTLRAQVTATNVDDSASAVSSPLSRWMSATAASA